MLKRKKKKPAFRRPSFWLITVLVFGALTAAVWLWQSIHVTPHRLNYILLSVNTEPQKILSGETVSLHPNDRVKILKISTNIPFNFNIRLAAEGIDVNALEYEALKLSALLPGHEILEHYRFRIRVLYRNEELAHAYLNIRPFAEDWLEKADRVIDGSKRLALLERAAHLMPEDKRVKLRLLEEYRSQKLWKRLSVRLENRVAKETDRETLLELLDVYTAMKNRKGILSVLKRMVEFDPDDLEARYQFAEALEAEGQLKAAIREYEAVLGLAGKMDSDSETGVRALALYKQLGYLCTKTGSLKKAISFYKKAEKLDQRDANIYYNLSYLYDKTHQKKKSDIYLGKALRLKSGDVENRLKLSQSLIERGDLKSAENYLTEVLSEKPDSLDALLLMVRVLEKKGRKRDLVKIYRKILSLDPKNETVIYNLGVLLYETGDMKESLNYFKRYLLSHSKDAAVHAIVFDILKKGKKTREALKEARILLELSPNEMEPYRYLFDYLNSKGDFKEIIAIMEEGVETNPDKAELREYLVLAYLKTGDEEKAIYQMEEILKQRPKDVDLLLNLARLREKHGQNEGALNAYKRIIEISPDNEEAGEAYLRLRLEGVQSEGGK